MKFRFCTLEYSKELFKKSFFLILTIFLISCSTKERLSYTLKDFKERSLERIKVNLAQVPLIKRWIKLPPPPKEAYQKAEEKISFLKLSKAKDLYKEEYNKVLKEWQEASRDYEKKYYRSAEKKLKKVLESAENLLAKVEEYERNLRERASLRYKTLEKEILNRNYTNDEEKLKARLYLFRLKNLVELGKFDEFEREAEKVPF